MTPLIIFCVFVYLVVGTILARIALTDKKDRYEDPSLGSLAMFLAWPFALLWVVTGDLVDRDNSDD